MGKNNITHFNFHPDGRLFYATAVSARRSKNVWRVQTVIFVLMKKNFKLHSAYKLSGLSYEACGGCGEGNK